MTSSDTLALEVCRLREEYSRLLAENVSLKRDVKDAHKENAYLVRRLVNMHAAARSLCVLLATSPAGSDLLPQYRALLAVLDEVPPLVRASSAAPRSSVRAWLARVFGPT